MAIHTGRRRPAASSSRLGLPQGCRQHPCLRRGADVAALRDARREIRRVSRSSHSSRPNSALWASRSCPRSLRIPLSSDGFSRAATSTSRSSRWVYPEPVVEIKSIFGCGGADELTRVTASASSRVSSTRRTGSRSNASGHAFSRSGSAAREGCAGSSRSPLFQYVTSAARHASVRNVRLHPLNRALERGGLVARASSSAAAIAVSLLAVSGAGGASAQTPKRGGTLVFRLIGPEPACLERSAYELQSRRAGVLGREGSADAFRGLVRSDFTHEGSLVSRVDYTRRRPFTLTYHIRPEARWSDGVPITAQDFIFTLRAIRRHAIPEARELHAPIRSARAVEPKTLRVVLRPRSAELARLLREHPAVARAPRLGPDAGLGDRIDNPRTGRPIGSGPFLVERLERGRQLVLRRNSRYWGPHPAYIERLVLRFAESATDPSDDLRSGELDVAAGVPPSFVPAVRRLPGIRFVASASSGSSSSPSSRTERSPGAPQQARSPRARVRDRPHRARPTDMGRGRSLRSRARQRACT